MNRDGAGWRKKVEWDSVNKVYTYRGHEILPLTWDERNRMPIYLQHNFYWDEIDRIDFIEDNHYTHSKEVESAMSTLDALFEYFETGDERVFE